MSVMEVTIAETNPHTELVTQQTFCQFSPKIQAGDNKRAIMTMSVVVVGRFYIALFSALEQTHCARM